MTDIITRIHTVRFYKPEPEAIYCMVLNSAQNKLAVSRSDASIELWNIKNTPFIERSIAPTPENFSIEGLAWFQNRLFSVGLHGLLVEYNLRQLNIKSTANVTGEAAFCLDVHNNKKQIAIGTEQGYLNIFSVEDDCPCFTKFLDKQEGRIICIKYDSTGEFVVTGSLDAIRIWNVESGHALHKLTTSRAENKTATIIWCLAITNDFTIISGDSRGKITFWDGKVGSQIESYQSHKADILAISLSEDQTEFFCAGVDPNITNYVRVKMTSGEKYVKSVQRKIHEHDVRTLTANGNFVYSGGIDGYLACSSYPPPKLLKFPPILQNPCVEVALETRLVLLRFSNYIEIWTLGESCNEVDPQYRGLLQLTSLPKKLLELQRSAKIDGELKQEDIICSAISSDGSWVAFSTQSGLRLFQLIIGADGTVNLNKVEGLEKSNEACLLAVFTQNSRLTVAPCQGGLRVYNLKNLGVEQAIEFKTGQIGDTITFLTASKCGKFLVVADPLSNIVIFSFNKNKWEFYHKLPTCYTAAPTALAIHPKFLFLIVSYSDNQMVECNLVKKNFRQLRQNQSAPTKHYPVRNICFDERADNLFFMQTDTGLWLARKEVDKSSEKLSKISKLDTTSNSTVEISLKQINKRKHLIFATSLSDFELVAVEVNPLSLIEQLPPVMVQETFGTK